MKKFKETSQEVSIGMSKTSWAVLGLSCVCLGLLAWSIATPRAEAQVAGQAAGQIATTTAPQQQRGSNPFIARTVTQGSLAPTAQGQFPSTAPGVIQQTAQGLNTAGAPALPGTTVMTSPLTGTPIGLPLAETRSLFANRLSQEENNLIVKTQQLCQKLRSDDREESDDELENELRTVLEEHFELRMQHREDELEKLEERLNKLRDELDSRRSAKEEIVDLRHQSLVNEAKGLGF